MATITKIALSDGTVRYKARVRRQGQEGETSRSFSTKKDAERWAKQFEVQLERDDAGLTHEAQRHTLADATKRYRLEILPTLNPSTQPNYNRHLGYWEGKLGHLRLSEVQAVRIAEARDELIRTPQAPKRAGGEARFRTPTTTRRYLATLQAVLTACVKRWHWLADTPMRQVEKPSEGTGKTRFLSEAELGLLLAACRESTSPDLLLAVMLAVTTGARAGELLTLRWRDVDLEAGLIQVRVDNETTTKGGVRTLALVHQVRPLMQARFEQAKARELDRQRQARVAELRDLRSDLIFPSRVTASKPIDLRKPFTTALAKAGIADFRWHDLRHSTASFLAKDGASLLEIGAVLGHRSTQTTLRYSHLAPSHTHTLIRGLADDLLGAVGGEQ
ncbi:MAG: tyrosine-type recombinase/integrase [Chromatiaceae bacterium]